MTAPMSLRVTTFQSVGFNPKCGNKSAANLADR
jgi:hypothetical protein